MDDTEPKFGLAVTGIVDIDRIWKNSGMKAGDALILTKPLGTGILSTAAKRGMADKRHIEALTALMSALNKTASETAANFTVHACTDITGFGLLGHLREMVIASGVSAEIWADEVPLLEGAEDFALAGIIPGGTMDNYSFVEKNTIWAENLPMHIKYLLCDAQTSGGLLFSIPLDEAEALLSKLREAGIKETSIIGEAMTQRDKLLCVK